MPIEKDQVIINWFCDFIKIFDKLWIPVFELFEYSQTKKLLTNPSFFCKQGDHLQMGLRDISVWGYSAAALALLCAGREILEK